MVHVAVAQFAPTEDKRQNLKQIHDLLDAARGARLVVLPEYAMFTAPAIDERFVASAETLDGEFVTALRDRAAEHNMFIVAGFNEARPSEQRISNTLVALGPDGSVVARYRKLHLFDAFGYQESAHVHAGDIGELETFTVDGLIFGMQTCYDLRFPELTRKLVDAGADAILQPAAWVAGPLKEDHWTTLVRARAIENTSYLVAADQCGPIGSGHSMIVDPMGVVLTGLGERIGVASAELSGERIAEVRAKNPSLELRRFTVTGR